MKFRKKPVVIEAVQYDGANYAEIEAFVREPIAQRLNAIEKPDALLFDTLEGTMAAIPGDWIIRGVKGELYPCKPDVFEATYEAAEDA